MCLSTEEAVSEALHYARQRWCWDDPEDIREIMGRSSADEPFITLQDVRDYIDNWAEDFGFDDPHAPWGRAA